MTLSTVKTDIVEIRRERIAHLRGRGLSAREIADELGKGDNKIVNPDTGEPYTHTTVLTDLKTLKSQWRKSAKIAIDEHVARQFAELQEVKRLGWQQEDGDLIVRAIGLEMKLLGTMKQPDGVNPSVPSIMFVWADESDNSGHDGI